MNKMLKLNIIIMMLLIMGQGNKIPKVIWIYWENGFSNLGQFTKMCIKNIKYYGQLDGWKINLISKHNVLDWAPQIQQIWSNQYFYTIFKRFSGEYVAQKADILRLLLLKKYGGVWIDANIFLIERLTWLQRIQQNQNISNKIGKTPQVFMFTFNGYGSGQYIVMKNKKVIYISPGYQTWFIASIPNSKLISDWYDEYLSYIKRGNQYLQNQLDRQSIEVGFMNAYKVTHYLAVSQAIQAVVQKKQNQLDKKWDWKVNQRSTAVEEYGIWHIDSGIGPLKCMIDSEWSDKQCVIMLQSNQQNVQKKYGKKKYLIKNSGQRYSITNNLIQILKKNNSLYDKLKSYIKSTLDQIFCYNLFQIEQGSYIDIYLLQISKLEDIQKKKKSEKQYICKKNYIGIVIIILIAGLLIYLVISFKVQKLKKQNEQQQQNIGNRDQ